MRIKQLHKVIGLMLVLPFLGWIITGVVFLTKPGYAGAYERIQPKYYPLEAALNIAPQPNWQVVTVKRTTLGAHLLVQVDGLWQQLDIATLEPALKPGTAELKRLVQDAASQNPERYGDVVDVSDNVFTTSTGVELTLDWPSLSIRQRGRDTRLIGALYKIHYLQWSGFKWFDLALGVIGLLSLLAVVVCGVLLWWQPRKR